MGEPIRNSEGRENGEERLGRRTPCGGKPGGGYSEEARLEAGSEGLEADLGGEEPGLEGGDIGLGEPGPGDLEPGTWAVMSEAGPGTRDSEESGYPGRAEPGLLFSIILTIMR